MRGWNQTVQKMIDAFVLMLDYNVLTDEGDKKVTDVLELFLQVFPQSGGLGSSIAHF